MSDFYLNLDTEPFALIPDNEGVISTDRHVYTKEDSEQTDTRNKFLNVYT